ncbi:MAG: HAMP domain-containing histidine kinase [Flavobacteriales bacterium]|nr:HAMP domain-containing histidine kinase [Flavobacteriales bacterium]
MKLTHYISLRYIGVTVLVMLISIPIFYFVLQNVLTGNIDENLQDQKALITKKLQNADNKNFVILENEITVAKSSVAIPKERLFTKEIYNKDEHEKEFFRILQFSVKSNNTNYNVQIKESFVESEDLLKIILKLLISILLVLIVTLLFINYKIKQNIWTPFYKTLSELKNFRVDKTEDLHLEKSKINELNDLNFSLKELSSNNKKVYQSQKEFTENASHEIQTPLAIVQNNIDLFWQTENISENQANIINEISTATIRMSKLNQALLLLSKIENKQFSETEVVNLNRLAEHFFKNYQEQIRFKELNLKTNLSRFFLVNMNSNLAEILVGNLLLNALKYSPKSSVVNVDFTENDVQISNESAGKSLATDLLFKRFQRQNSKENGTGLGLEIAKQIADSSGLKLTYEFKENRHFFLLRR